MDRKKKYLRSINGLIHSIYDTQKYHSKNRNHKPPQYSFEQLNQWLLSQSDFQELYDNWVSSGYKTDLKPSVDRPNEDNGYSLDNIQLMTWKENREKYYKDVLSGKKPKAYKAVRQLDKSKNIVNTFFSQAEASRKTGVLKQSICKACLGQIKSAGGFLWESY